MTILAIDTSSRTRTVCVTVARSGAVVRSVVRVGETVALALPAAIRDLLDDEVSELVAVRGPGSYTGLRAGMAAALGVAQARRLPLHLTGTLDVVARGVPETAAAGAVAVDAGRGAVYAASCTVRDGVCVPGPPARVTVEELRSWSKIVASPDELRIPAAIRVDPVAALSRGAIAALESPPAEPAGLSGVYSP